MMYRTRQVILHVFLTDSDSEHESQMDHMRENCFSMNMYLQSLLIPDHKKTQDYTRH